jgi:hypothetical protein
MPEGVGYPKKKKRKGSFLRHAQDLVRKTKTTTGGERAEAVKARETFRSTLRTVRTGRPPEEVVRRPGRTLREKGGNLMRELGRFATGKPRSKFAARPARPRATAARPATRRPGQRTTAEAGVRRTRPPGRRRGVDRLQELEEMGLVTPKERDRFLRSEEKRILNR